MMSVYAVISTTISRSRRSVGTAPEGVFFTLEAARVRVEECARREELLLNEDGEIRRLNNGSRAVSEYPAGRMVVIDVVEVDAQLVGWGAPKSTALDEELARRAVEEFRSRYPAIARGDEIKVK